MTKESKPMFAPLSRWKAMNGWKPIEGAPRDGRHILAADFSPGAGFGWFNGVNVPFMAVVHYWPQPGEQGFYLSSGASSEIDDQPLTRLTHWMPLPEPLGTGFAGDGV